MNGQASSVLAMLEALHAKLIISESAFDSKFIGNSLFGLLVMILYHMKNRFFFESH